AERFAEEDKKKKEEVEIKNRAEQVIYQSEKSLTDIGDKASDSDKQPVREAIDKLKETMKSDNVDAIKADTEALEKAFYPIAEKLYQQGQAQGQQGQPNGAPEQGPDGTYYSNDFEDKSGN
ncbi:MAG: Hsp70 family protein, partial [Clostridia bacterium]|nr:Hsp70 family protein [Clostridia bacterium]